MIDDLESEKNRLEKEAEDLVAVEGGSESERLMDIYAILDDLEADTALRRAGTILHGLGFNKDMQV